MTVLEPYLLDYDIASLLPDKAPGYERIPLQLPSSERIA